MFFKKKKIDRKSYDKTLLKPVIKKNIYTQQKIAGFKEIKTGKFHEEKLITNQQDLAQFMETYDIKDEELLKEW